LDARIREDQVVPSTNEVATGIPADPRDQALSHAVLQAFSTETTGWALRLAEEWCRLAADAPVLHPVK
jgi:hypothetical protein